MISGLSVILAAGTREVNETIDADLAALGRVKSRSAGEGALVESGVAALADDCGGGAGGQSGKEDGGVHCSCW